MTSVYEERMVLSIYSSFLIITLLAHVVFCIIFHFVGKERSAYDFVGSPDSRCFK